MKKYCIATSGENRKQVVDALTEAGFGTNDFVVRQTGLVLLGVDGSAVRVPKIRSSRNTGTLNRLGYELIEPSYVIAHAAELDGAQITCLLEGLPMEEWLDNKSHIRFAEMPPKVKEEICMLWDGKKDSTTNLQFYNYLGGGWTHTTCAPQNSKGSTYRIVSKEIWEVAEEGYRIVTIQEREDNAYPTDCKVRWAGVGVSWTRSTDPKCWIPEDPQQDCKAFAVPIDYKFKPSTVSVVCEGKTVELSRESAKALNLI